MRTTWRRGIRGFKGGDGRNRLRATVLSLAALSALTLSSCNDGPSREERGYELLMRCRETFLAAKRNTVQSTGSAKMSLALAIALDERERCEYTGLVKLSLLSDGPK